MIAHIGAVDVHVYQTHGMPLLFERQRQVDSHVDLADAALAQRRRPRGASSRGPAHRRLSSARAGVGKSTVAVKPGAGAPNRRGMPWVW